MIPICSQLLFRHGAAANLSSRPVESEFQSEHPREQADNRPLLWALPMQPQNLILIGGFADSQKYGT